MNLLFLVQFDEEDMQIQLHTEIDNIVKEYDSDVEYESDIPDLVSDNEIEYVSDEEFDMMPPLVDQFGVQHEEFDDIPPLVDEYHDMPPLVDQFGEVDEYHDMPPLVDMPLNEFDIEDYEEID